MTYTIRPAHIDEADLLPAIEQSAARSFLSDASLAWIADDDVMSSEMHRKFIAAGTSWVALPGQDQHPSQTLSGFVACEVVGDVLHIWELAVHEDSQRRGIGAALMNAAIDFARERGLSVTLSTFIDVPWNAPFYERLGFRVLNDSQLTPRLKEILAHEIAQGLPGDRRCSMQLDPAPDQSPSK